MPRCLLAGAGAHIDVSATTSPNIVRILLKLGSLHGIRHRAPDKWASDIGHPTSPTTQRWDRHMGESGHGHQHTVGGGTGCCERLEAEGEAALARLILDGGDLAHAASHVGGAVGSDPALPEAYEVLASFVSLAGGPDAALAYFPETLRYTGALACRAALLAAIGDVDTAVVLLAAIMAAAPAQPWASVAWLAAPSLAAALSPAAVATSLAHVTQALADPASPAARAVVEPYYALVTAVASLHPAHLRLLAMASSLARRMDDLDRAIAWAEAARAFRVEETGDALGVVMLGTALRRAGREAETIELWYSAFRSDPSQTYLAVDLAETLAAHGRAEEGISVLDQVLAVEPDHEKAAASVHDMRYQVSSDSRHLLALYEHLQRHPDHDYAEFLLRRRCSGTAWLGQADWATEAVINGVRQLIERFGAGYESTVEMQLSGLEPPSAGVAARFAAPALSITTSGVSVPDPRLAVRDVSTLVWRFDGTTPKPAVEAPSPRALALARDLATPRWSHPAALYDRALPLGELPVADLLGLLAYPPSPADAPWANGYAAQAPDVWVRAVQALACLGIAHHRPEQPWGGSARREVLLDLLDGPEDWVCEAAGMALVAVGWADSSVRDEAASRLVARLGLAVEAARTRPVSILASLCRLALACAWLGPGDAASLRGLLAQITEEGGGEGSGDEGDEANAGDACDGDDGGASADAHAVSGDGVGAAGH
jgi:tetratricopeptide (TPR) repeat protein